MHATTFGKDPFAAIKNDNSNRIRLRQHFWVFLCLMTLMLAHNSFIDYGNQMGHDEWGIFRAVSEGSLTYYNDRPLHLLSPFVGFVLFGPHRILNHALLLLVKFGNAFLLYLLVQRFFSRKPLFGFICAGLYSTYIVDDHFMLLGLTEPGIHLSSVFFALAALYLFLRYMSHRRIFVLLLGLFSATISILMYEMTTPVLLVIPVLLYALDKDRSPSATLGIVSWLIVVGLASAHFVAPILGLGPEVWTSRQYEGIDVTRIISGTYIQLRHAFQPLLYARAERIVESPLPAVIAGGLFAISAIFLGKRLPNASEDVRMLFWKYLYWLGIGAVVTWLGFAPLLVIYRAGEPHFGAHLLSGIGEAIMFSAIIWLATLLVKHQRARVISRIVLASLVAVMGTVQAAETQRTIQSWGATWDTQAVFLRSISNQFPSLKENSLIVYAEDPTLSALPFVMTWAFPNAVSYIYNDQTAGLMPVRDAAWDLSADGVRVEETGPFHGWDEIVAVIKDWSGRAISLDTLPPEVFVDWRTGELNQDLLSTKANNYDPYARVNKEFVHLQVQELFPPLQFATLPLQWRSPK